MLHRWNGLLLALFLTIISLTGSILAWRVPLDHYFAPQLFSLRPHAATEPRLDSTLLAQDFALSHPAVRVSFIDLDTGPESPLTLYVDPVPGSPAQGDDTFMIDPYTGDLLGSRRDGDLRQGRRNLIPFVYKVHSEFALGPNGIVFVGVISLLWTLDCFVGLYLTFPASTRATRSTVLVRAGRWPLRWLPSWLIRRGASVFQRLYDLHRAPALWLWTMLLMFAWSGVAFNLPAIYQPVMRVFGAAAEVSPVVTPGCVSSSAAPAWQKGYGVASSKMQQEANRSRFHIYSDKLLSYDYDACRFTLRVRSSRDVSNYGDTAVDVSLGASPGPIFSFPTGVTRADTVTNWIEALHAADVFGAKYRLLVALTGVAVAGFSVTGVLMYYRKSVVSVAARQKRLSYTR